MVQNESITESLSEFKFAVAKVINDSQIDYFVNYFEPTEVYAFEVDTRPEVDPTILTSDVEITAGIIVVHIKQQEEIYACGAGQFKELHSTALEPIDSYFK